MHKIILMIALAVISNSAMAEWTRAGWNDESTSYVDVATIRKNGDLVKMWTMMDYKTVMQAIQGGFLSFKTQIEYDCKEEKSRTGAFSVFSGNMGSGQMIYSTDGPSKWSPVEPESAGEAVFKIACG